ncbi:MAG: hypothetical protein ABIY55_28695 [Kofleriaceae bacterium]
MILLALRVGACADSASLVAVADPPTVSDADSSCPSPAAGPLRSPLNNSVRAGDPGMRLTFSYDGTKIDLTSITARAVRPYAQCPSSAGCPLLAGANAGAWVEVRDGDGRILAQNGVFNPFGTSIEVQPPPDDPGGFMNERVCPTSAAFIVELPNDPVAREIRVYADPFAQELAAEGARLMARFKL